MIHLGFSDHSQGPLASSLAIAFGAVLFEKHFTSSHDLPGPDHWFSETPESLKVWADSIKTSREMLGSSIVRPTQQESEMRKIARRSLVALRDIKENEILTAENLGLRRPGTGLPPSFLERVLGMKATRPLKREEILQIGDFTR